MKIVIVIGKIVIKKHLFFQSGEMVRRIFSFTQMKRIKIKKGVYYAAVIIEGLQRIGKHLS